MNIGTILPQKYVNGVVDKEQSECCFKLVSETFNEVGPLAFGQIKFISPESAGIYKWSVLDNFYSSAKLHGLKSHYNTVINNKNSFPEWYWKLSPGEKVKALENHVRTVVSRFKGKFYLYKLVNEAVRDEETNFLGTGLNRADLLVNIFAWAKEEDPQALLMINDFGTIVRDDIRKEYIRLVNEIKSKGAPIDVIGEQGHLGHPSSNNTPVFQLPSDEMVKEALAQLHSSTGLPVYISEFDLSYDNSPSNQYGGSNINPVEAFLSTDGNKYDNWYSYQAYAYKHFLEICKDLGFVSGVTFWGFCDGDTLPHERPGTGFIDRDYKKKPAYFSL